MMTRIQNLGQNLSRNFVAALAAAILAATSAVAPAHAQQVGTATAVNPTSESTKPGAGTINLNVGANIVHKERIHTTPSGSVQLLFLDKSTLSIAPNTNLLIDEYIYNPKSNSGHMLTNLAEGALRFVGGALSHQGEASITTRDAAIGIRGGTVTVVRGPNGTKVINHFGVITVTNGAGTVTISRPGFFVLIANWNTPPGDPQRVTEDEIAYYLRLLTSKPGQNAGVPGLTNVTIGECGLGILPSYNCPPAPWNQTGSAESNAFQTVIQATQRATATIAPPPPPPTITVTPPTTTVTPPPTTTTTAPPVTTTPPPTRLR
jgi:FecR protein